MKRPNFFIVGGPKCGTTSLSEYLRTHPNVFISSPKEPYYFSTDLSLGSWSSEAEYLHKCFQGCEDQHWAVGEASAWYLFSSDAIPMILHFNPEAKFIVMVRNPVDMFHSLHSQMLYERKENVEDEVEAWHLQDVRRVGKNLPRLCRDPKLLQYGTACKLGRQLQKLYALAHEKQVKVVVFDDFVGNPKEAYEGVLQFLGVPPDHRSVFPVFNENKQVRSKSVANFIMAATLNPWVMQAFKATKRVFGLRALGFSLRNTVIQGRPPMPTNFREELGQYFREDVKTLSELVGCDLSHWTNVGSQECD